MTQAIIMTIRPKHLVKILNGEKTIEPRKTIPKCELPIDVYLYCTKEKPYLYENWDGRCYKLTRTKTWQERANEEDYTSVEMFHLEDFGGEVNGKVVAKFTLNKVGKVSLELIDSSGYDEDKEKEYVSEHLTSDELTSKSCLDEYNIDNYLLSRSGFAWHIDNLVVFDKPKELKEFYKQLNYGKEIITPNIATDQETLNTFRLTKAPQSWQYVWVKENNMREIKFRVWLNEENNYLYDGFGFFQKAYENEIFNDDGDEVTNFVVEQYTGLKDKNGKEIYEGDIVKVRKISFDDDIYIAKIVFQEIGRLGFAFVIDYKGDDGAIYYGLCKNNYIEVIGNIHENAELLKGETK